MRPDLWSTSYLLRCPLGISMVASNSTSSSLVSLYVHGALASPLVWTTHRGRAARMSPTSGVTLPPMPTRHRAGGPRAGSRRVAGGRAHAEADGGVAEPGQRQGHGIG